MKLTRTWKSYMMYACWISSETGTIHDVSYAILGSLSGQVTKCQQGRANKNWQGCASVESWELMTFHDMCSLACALTPPLSACTIAAQTWCVAGDFPGDNELALAMSTINETQGPDVLCSLGILSHKLHDNKTSPPTWNTDMNRITNSWIFAATAADKRGQTNLNIL